MKKILLSLLLPFLSTAQNQYSYGFNSPTASLTTDGWSQTNQSAPVGASTWLIPNDTPTSASPFGGVSRAGQAGGQNSFCLVNYNSTTGAGTISNWLISPSITVQNGDVVTFYSRKGAPATGTDYPDRLQLRIGLATGAVPSTGSADVGGFTTIGVDINPTLAAGFVYPASWTQYSYTVAGYPSPTAVKLGFRYHVTNAGPNGANSDIIGIDTISVDRPLSTNQFFQSNFSIYPNPANDLVNITKNSNIEIKSVSVTDMNGRVVKEIANEVASINIADLTTGVYFLKITTAEGSGTTKLMKN